MVWLHDKNKVAYSSVKKVATLLYTGIQISVQMVIIERLVQVPVLANLVVILHSFTFLNPHLQ